MRVQLVTAPAVEPLSLDEAKLHLRVDFADDDALISSLIVAARRYCETVLRQALITSTFDYFEDGWPAASGGYFSRIIRQQGPSLYWLPTNAGILNIPKPPLQTVVSVQYLDSATGDLLTIDPSLYYVSAGTPGRIQPVFGQVWPVCRPMIDAVRVRIICGYGDDAAAVPDSIKAAMRLLIGNWYENREDEIVGTVAARLQRGVDALLGAEDHGAYS